MARGSRGRHTIASRQLRPTPYPLPACKKDMCDALCSKRCSTDLDKNDWENVTCSVCMEYPHNAVLLLCSSHDKGCRPYMCGTSLRHSNCLEQYKKAYTKVVSSNLPLEKSEITELACPLCRGQVKGWTVVEHAREYFNAKKRSCMQDNCTFVGNYKELKKHVRADHPSARPRAVDPAHEQKWQLLEWEREREDVISTITSAMPGARVFGDYVIEGNDNDLTSEDEDGDSNVGSAERSGRFHMDLEAMNFFLLFHAVRQGNELNFSRQQLGPELASGGVSSPASALHAPSVGRVDFSDQDDDNNRFSEGVGLSLASRLHRHGRGRFLFGRSSRRRRRREAHTRGRM
ncbi:uncharacterized protein LOC114732200 isoform X2 [Neltuma alba]|nr:uncharacterized protein LOC114712849 isoform X2 [Prosopis alba]XP_028753239.1 uncharacterized protein LOC114712849 isoform X2 [Prosopis alba]XP_028753240.1 uncharacterized protein LOC114712849 isoform X2 [Prosopis alba]XP_028753241.1 uncharacterized protein LOC114712849 isoform X2 [Prosopis alba]XP_028753242.1 uncharacterized protein LOC114712849 isoform X2 [Prosopis alba]XP_028753243.1 uncharacterized protein LOC114712849 isoform X2 [Prosopis alba]XP_028775323.1 uncharacterized protein LO